MKKELILESVETYVAGGHRIKVRKRIIDGDAILMDEPHILQASDGEAADDAIARLDENLSNWPYIRKVIEG